MIWQLYNIVGWGTEIKFGRLSFHLRSRISCGEHLAIVCLQECGCNKKVSISLISARCVKRVLKIFLICSSCVVKVCFVGSTLVYGVSCWLSLTLLQVS